MKKYNVVVVYDNGTALTAVNVSAINKGEVVNKYWNNTNHGNVNDIVSITVIEQK